VFTKIYFLAIKASDFEFKLSKKIGGGYRPTRKLRQEEMTTSV